MKRTHAVLALFVGLQLLLLELGAVFVAGGGARRGLFAAYVALAAASVGAGAAAWWRASRQPGAASRRRRRAAVLAVALLWLAALRWSIDLPRPHLYVLVSLLVTGLALLAVHAAGGGLGPLLFGCPLLLLGTLLFGAELLWPAAHTDQVDWGTDSTFRTMYMTRPPFVFPGGRLHRNLDVRMRSREEPEGVRLITNSEGLLNREDLPFAPAPGELRVLDLGDSFSIGMQVDQDEFFGARLERELAAASGARTVTVINAEVSDPAHALLYLQNHGAEYAPRIVVVGLCGNDMHQVHQFCGPGRDKRFRLDEQGRIRPNPDFVPASYFASYAELIYPRQGRVPPSDLAEASPGRRLWRLRALGQDLGRFELVSALQTALLRPGDRPQPMFSYLAEHERRDGHMRLIDGCANLGYFYRHEVPLIEDMYRELFAILAGLQATARAQGALLVVVLYPQRYQVNAADWGIARERWNLAEEDFDLELYDRRVQEACASMGIPCCDLLETFRAQERQLYLPGGDMHINRAGHRLAAEVLAGFLVEARLLPDPASLEPGSEAFEAAKRLAEPEPLRPWRFEATLDEPGGGMASFHDGRLGSEGDHLEHLLLSGGLAAPTTIAYDLRGRAQTFRAQAWLEGWKGGANPDLEVRVDGRVVWSGRLRPPPSIPLAIDLAGAQRLELTLGPRARAGQRGRVVLSNPCFERAPLGADAPRSH